MAVVRKIVRLRFFLALVLTSIIIIYFIVFKNAYVRRKVEEYSFLKFENQTMRKTIANLFKCENNYMTLNESDYSKEADKTLHNMRIVRGLILYFPADKHSSFFQEFRWLYRSWIEMQKYEPELWRTDLIIYMSKKLAIENNIMASFGELDCKLTNLRSSRNDKPMCTIIDYVSINDRLIENTNETYLKIVKPMELYPHLFNDIDVFNQSDANLWKFYAKLKDLRHYSYIDSILMAFDGYNYFKNNFDFLLRSDMDIFLTPLFAKWLPLNCYDFVCGGGGYGHEFNMKRIQKAAKNINLEPGDVWNLGSTWYSSPNQIRLVSYLTLVSMIYLSNEEFTKVERQGQLGVMLWPGNLHFNKVLNYLYV